MADNGTVYIKTVPDPQSEANEVAEKLGELVSKTNNIIYEISSVFPFQLFPDRIIVDENKVTIARKDLFFKRVFPLMYEDILTVRVNRGLIFAAMEFEIKRARLNPRPITYLWPKEAANAKKYIMGIIEAKKQKIDVSKLTAGQIRETLEEIGQAEEEAENLF